MTHGRSLSIWDPAIVRGAVGGALRKLHPRTMAKNPVVFVVEVGSVLTTVALLRDAVARPAALGFELQISAWLWLTVVFANFAEAMAEGRGKAQADTLRRTRTDTTARRLHSVAAVGSGVHESVIDIEDVPAASLRTGDVVLVN